jgi:hypothetical protein
MGGHLLLQGYGLYSKHAALAEHKSAVYEQQNTRVLCMNNIGPHCTLHYQIRSWQESCIAYEDDIDPLSLLLLLPFLLHNMQA